MEKMASQKPNIYEITRTEKIETLGIYATMYIGKSDGEKRRKNLDNDDYSQIHTHSSFELFFSLNDGEEIYTERGKVSFGNMAAIIPPNLRHFLKSNTGQAPTAFLFDLSPIEKTDSKIYDFLIKKLADGPIVTDFSFIPINFENFSALLRSDTSSEIEQAQYIAFAALTGILSEIYQTREYKKDKMTWQPRNIVLIENSARELLAEGDLSLKTLSEKVYLTPKQIEKIIMKTYGTGFTKHINSLKLSIACALLKNTCIPISQVAEKSYFISEKYFYSIFKATYGITPKKYRTSFSDK